jgi:branched-chain amino acid transport system substrate-binding protein
MAATATLLAGCGSRMAHDEIVAGAGGGPVTLAASSDQQQDLGSAGSPGTVPDPNAAAVTGDVTAPSKGGPSNAGQGAGSTTPGKGTSPTGPAVSTKPGAGGNSASTAAACTRPGAPVVFGQVGTFSGVLGPALSGGVPGLKVWAAAQNALGGVACHPIEIVSIDDGGDVGKAQSAVRSLVEERNAVALNAVSPLTLNGIQPYVKEHKIPVIGGDQVAVGWASGEPMLFPIGGTLEQALFAPVKYAAMQGGKKYSFLYCVEATTCTQAHSYLTGGMDAKTGMQSVGDQPISLTGSNFTQQCKTAQSRGADVIIVGAAASTLAAIARDCRNQNYRPMFVTASVALAPGQERDPNLDGLIVSTPVFPWMRNVSPAEQEFQSAVKRYAPTTMVTGQMAASWTAGVAFEKAVTNLGADGRGTLSSDLILRGLASFKKETLGGLVAGSLTFRNGAAPDPNRCMFIARISGGKWTDPAKVEPICEP